MSDDVKPERDSLLERLDTEVRHGTDREKSHAASIQLLHEARAAYSAKKISDEDLYDFVYWVQVAWLRLKWGSGEDAAACPFCGNTRWTLSEPISLLSNEFGPISRHFGVTCGNCGQTVFVSAESAGITEDDFPIEAA